MGRRLSGLNRNGLWRCECGPGFEFAHAFLELLDPIEQSFLAFRGAVLRG
jgi:hypothetical protein